MINVVDFNSELNLITPDDPLEKALVCEDIKVSQIKQQN